MFHFATLFILPHLYKCVINIAIRVTLKKIAAVISAQHVHNECADSSRPRFPSIAVNQQSFRVTMPANKPNDLLRLRSAEQFCSIHIPLYIVEVKCKHAFAECAFVEHKAKAACVSVLDRDYRVGVPLLREIIKSRRIIVKRNEDNIKSAPKQLA